MRVTQTLTFLFFKITAVKESSGVENPNYVFVAGGSFNNGAATITISSFFLNKYEVTQAEYENVMGENPAHSYGVGDNYPVYYVSWYQTITYCNLLSMQEGLTPCYNYNNEGTDPNTWSDGWDTSNYSHLNISCNFDANGYRLPTEIEWMYAAKGGTMTPPIGYPVYSGTNLLEDLVNYAWYDANNNPEGTKAIGTKNYNILGLYDMSGNISEFCWDIYTPLSEENQTDPTGPITGSDHVSRGGNWDYSHFHCQVNYRSRHHIPTFRDSHIGFRLAKSSE